MSIKVNHVEIHSGDGDEKFITIFNKSICIAKYRTDEIILNDGLTAREDDSGTTELLNVIGQNSILKGD